MTELGPRADTIKRPVEHCDIDAYGVVHFSRYAALFETAALAKLKRMGQGLSELEKAGLELRVRKLQISYREAARYGDLLLLEADIGRSGVAHLELVGRIFRETDGGQIQLLADGVLDFVFVDTTTNKPMPIPCQLSNQRRV